MVTEEFFIHTSYSRRLRVNWSAFWVHAVRRRYWQYYAKMQRRQCAFMKLRYLQIISHNFHWLKNVYWAILFLFCLENGILKCWLSSADWGWKGGCEHKFLASPSLVEQHSIRHFFNDRRSPHPPGLPHWELFFCPCCVLKERSFFLFSPRSNC